MVCPTADCCSLEPVRLTSAYMMSCGLTKLTTSSQGVPAALSVWPWVRIQRIASAAV